MLAFTKHTTQKIRASRLLFKISKDEKEDISEVNIIKNYPDLGIYYVNQSYLAVRKLRT